jgi:peptidoglycan/LPS O-acetylase OafA/YrhL
LNGKRVALPHIEALDGLRGLAVLAILLFHAGHLTGGWLGVDLFFVLSGFLITSLLLTEYETTGTVDLIAFWGRRARRLLPALFAALFGVCLYAAVVARPEELARIRADVIATLFYVANWHSISTGHDYWEIFRAPSPLDHTWSLAIEEQFYLLWPPALLLIVRRVQGGVRSLTGVTLFLALLSTSWMAACYDPEQSTARVYYGTDTRVAASLIGAAIASAFRAQMRQWPGRPRRQYDVAAFLLLLILCWAATELNGNDSVVYRGGLFAFILASGGVIVGVLLCPTGITSRVLSLAPLKMLGTVSYGVYLWHWPIYLTLTEARVGLGGWSLTGVRVALTLAVAVASYFALEVPVRRNTQPVRRMLAAGASATLGVLTCAWIVTDAVPESEALIDSHDAARIQSAGAAVQSDVLLIGDSVPHALRVEFKRMARKHGMSAHVMAAEGCGSLRSTAMRFLGGQTFSLEPCLEFRDGWITAVTEANPEAVLLIEGWSGEGVKRVEGNWVHPCQEGFDAAYADDLSDLIRRFKATGARPIIASMPPPVAEDLAAGYAKQWGDHTVDELQSIFLERMACLNRVRSEVADRTGIEIFDLATLICPDGACRREINGFRLRPDGMHFTGASAAWVSDWLLGRVTAPKDRR